MKRIYTLLLLPFFLLTACDSWLDVVPEEDITTIDTDFETRDNAYAWFKSCYVPLNASSTSVRDLVEYTATDEVVMCQYLKNAGYFVGDKIISGKQNVFQPYADRWINGMNPRSDFYAAINLCNIFIDKIDQVYNMEEKEKKEWKGEVIAVKAYYYFELVRHYGPIVLVPDFMDPNQDVSSLKLPRSHVDSCFQMIVNLCDEAVRVGIPSSAKQQSTHWGYFNKEAVMALKARALCYQASDLFANNPVYADFKNKKGELLFPEAGDAVAQKEKWHRAALAADEAIEACRNAGKMLIDNSKATSVLQTHMLNIEKSVRAANFSSTEALLMIRRASDSGSEWWYWALPRLISDPIGGIPGTQLAPSMKMVEMFYTENGLPLGEDRAYSGNIYGMTQEKDPKYSEVVALNEDILVLHTKREPRFYASIGADRCYWRIGRSSSGNFKVEAQQGEEFGLRAKRITGTAPENLTGYWLKKGTCSEAELFNYSSTVAGFGENPMILIRMAELYLISAEAWNEYLDAPDEEHVYKSLNVVRKRAGIPDVEVSWAGARNRNNVKTKAGMREIIRQEWNIEYMFEGMRFWNLRRWKIAEKELNDKLFGWKVAASDQKAFYNNGNGPVVVESNREFVAPRDYFWPIKSEETLISGIVQNLGW